MTKESKRVQFAVSIILGAYLVTGVLSAKCLLSGELFLKLEQSFSGRDLQSIALDELPFWTSHKHLTSLEQYSSDHILSSVEPWIGTFSTERFGDFNAAHLHVTTPFFPPTAFRAPPKS
jgi:hypothetical protein